MPGRHAGYFTAFSHARDATSVTMFSVDLHHNLFHANIIDDADISMMICCARRRYAQEADCRTYTNEIPQHPNDFVPHAYHRRYAWAILRRREMRYFINIINRQAILAEKLVKSNTPPAHDFYACATRPIAILL